MANKSKFKKGQKVKSILNKFEEYEIIEVTKNDLIVCPVGHNERFKYRKAIFEVIEK